jgi:hypothetical protein
VRPAAMNGAPRLPWLRPAPPAYALCRVSATYADKPHLYPHAPPFAALREAGKGRLAVVAVSPVYTIWGYGHPMWQGVTMTEGDG